jgi:DNA repair protein SbcC/Rad50
MRLHHLDIHAFGPFAGHEKVDFDALAGSGIFLLNGPTGAGKTSILDAICFALYGKVPGARGDRLGDIRSHLADADQLTRVVLEFSVRGRRLKVTREPTQTRPKKAGTGTTDHAATAVLQELSGSDWVPLASKSGDVTTMATDLMGLNADQFQQVILLPQGEFAQFLRANSDDRQKLLQAVFDTRRFSSIEDWLRDESRRLGTTLTKLEGAVTAAFNECAGALDLEGPEDNDPDRRNWLDSHEARLKGLLADAQTQAAKASAAAVAAGSELANITTIADRQERHRRALEQREQSASDLAELPSLKAQHDAACKAVAVRTALEHIENLSADLSKAADALEAAEQALTDLRPDLEGVTPTLLAAAADQLTRNLGALDALAEVERRALPDAQRRVETAEAAVIEVNTQIERLTETIAALDTSLANDRAFADDGAKAVELIQGATAVESEWRQTLGRANDRARVEAQREEALAELSKASAERQRADDHRNAVFARRLASMSAELAGKLEVDTPCPVCGSHDHPLPAKPTDDHATQSDLTAADEKVDEWAKRASGLAERVDGYHKRIQEINDAIGSESLDSVTAMHAAALATLGGLERRRDLGNEARVRLDDAESRRQGLNGQLDEQRIVQPGHVAEAAAARSELVRLRTSIDDGRDGHDSIAARIKALTGEVSAIDAVTKTRNRHDEVTNQLATAHKTVTTKAHESGFTGVDMARAAMLTDDAIDTLLQRIEGLERIQTGINVVIHDTDVIDAAKLPPADKSEATSNDANAREAERQANLVVHHVEQQIGTLGRCRTTLNDAVDEGGPLRERHDMVRSLADLARGEKGGASSGTRMRLCNYVLSARLAQVTTAASTRLRTMTDGRYTLLQTDDSGHGGRQGGLGIEVLDAFSGRTRSTQSLSGGESFAASLALALGLADVVAAEAGGISLDTLFIDEGFGTLDGESLNGVLDILDGLRSGGRTVGVVSHVADMKERIPTHVRVERIDRVSHITQ